MKKFLFIFCISIFQFAAAQDYDNTFGINGLVNGFTLYEGINKIEVPTDIKYEPGNGNLIMLNQFNDYGGTLQRFKTDGSIDLDFGAGGAMELPLGDDDNVINVFLEGDNYRVTGYKSDDGDTYSPLLMAALNDGSFDNTFGTDGISIEYGIDMLIGSNSCHYPGGPFNITGRNLASGFSDPATALMSFNNDGSYDADFGFVTLGIEYYTSIFDSYALFDGRILIAGSTYNDTHTKSIGFIGCYLSTGEIDNSFGTNGFVFPETDTINTGFIFKHITLSPDGYIYACGEIFTSPNAQIFVVKLNVDGEVQFDYGYNGFVYIKRNLALLSEQILVNDQNSCYVLGIDHPSGSGDMETTVFKLLPDGTKDISFTNGTAGEFQIIIDGAEEVIGSQMIIQPDGKLVVLGRTEGLGANSDYFICRITTNDIIDIAVEEKNTMNINVFPNPAHTILNLQGDVVLESVEIFSMDGRRILSQNIHDFDAAININTLPVGTYLLKSIEANNNYQCISFIKK